MFLDSRKTCIKAKAFNPYEENGRGDGREKRTLSPSGEKNGRGEIQNHPERGGDDFRLGRERRH